MSADPAAGARDPRVVTAFAHWGGRMVANGVPFADLEALRAEVSRWEDWCAAWSARALVHERLGDAAAADGHLRSAGEHWTQAAACYHFATFLFFDDPAAAGASAARGVACRTRALPHLDPPGERVEVPFAGTVLPGNLRLPAGPGPAPVVVMVMGLDSTKEEMSAHEADFLARGLATFAFDGPGQGEVQHSLPIRHDFEVPVAAVLDVLAGDPRLDSGRVGLWGVSLGGYSAPRAAAFAPRLRACVSLSGPFDLGEAWDALPDLTREAFRVRSHAAGQEDARRAAAKLDLTGVAERITCPLLVVSGGRDRLFDPTHAARLVAATGGPVDHLAVPEGAHVVNNLPHRYRPQSADWLADHLHAR